VIIIYILFILYIYFFLYEFNQNIYGDWGLGIGDGAQSPIPNPQSPIPNPQSPFNIILKLLMLLIIKYIILKINLFKNI